MQILQRSATSFVDPLAAAEIASWPASKIEPLSWPIVAELPVSMSVVLKTTAYVADNHRIVIRGAQNTILPYTNQLIVQPRGVLELSSVTVTGSVDSSAIKVLGTALLTNVTMKENGVRSTQDTCVPGAALTLMVGSYCKVISGRFLENNAGYQKCGQGGAISMVQECTLDCHDCELSGNQAHQGAGLFVLDGSKAKFSGTTVWNSNCASDAGGVLCIVRSGSVIQEGLLHAARNQAGSMSAGAVGYLFVGGTVRLENANLVKNSGMSTRGTGGVFVIDRDGQVYCTNCMMDGNEVGMRGKRTVGAYGGVIAMNAGYARLDRCTIVNSVANLGGGMAMVKGGKLEVIDSRISGSSAVVNGGVATVEAGGVLDFTNTAIEQSSAVSKGSVFDNIGGKIVLRSTNVTQSACNGTSWISGSAVASFNFHRVRFVGAAEDECYLFEGDGENKAFAESEGAIFTSSRVENVKMTKSGEKLNSGTAMAVRNSVFSPPLDDATTPWLSCFKPGMSHKPLNMLNQPRTRTPSALACQNRCVSVSGCAYFSWWREGTLEGDGGCHLQDSNAEEMPSDDGMTGPAKCTTCQAAGCDARITTCQAAQTGGVNCYCQDANMSFSGNVDDGGSCQQYSSPDLFSQSKDLELIIRKPLPSGEQQLVMQVKGDTQININFAAYEYDRNSLRQHTSDYRQLGMNGLHVLWSNAPKPFETVSPEGKIKEQVFIFRVSFNCSLAPAGLSVDYPCAGDGHVAHTILSLSSSIPGLDKAPNIPDRNVNIKARVEALPSCELIKVEVTPDGDEIEHKLQSGLIVKILIFDADNQPINVSSPQLNIIWQLTNKMNEQNSWELPFQRQESGSHIFTSIIRSDHFENPGRCASTLIMSLNDDRNDQACGIQVQPQGWTRKRLELSQPSADNLRTF